MERAVPERLAGWEIHGFHTMEDLDVGNMKEEAKARWLRPNEIHAILCNYKYFSVHVKPLNLPKGGTIVLFDRKMLRNFRKDGHNWKKKKDGKTVKEAHEHLKVGNEERIHVYYAHGEDNPTFVRRCYWLLDKTLEHIVFVHYRETQEGSPITPINSNSSSALSDLPASWLLSEETDSVADKAYYNAGMKADLEPGDGMTMSNLEMTLHEINTLEWEELLVTEDLSKLDTFEGAGKTLYYEQQNQIEIHGYGNNGNIPSTNNLPVGKSSFGNLQEPVPRSSGDHFNILDNNYSQRMAGQTNSKLQNKNSEFVTVGAGDSLDLLVKDGLQNQDSFGRWMNYIISDSPESVDNSIMESSISTVQKSFMSPVMDHHHSFVSEQIFSITDISPAWAFSNEQTKILVIGYFHEGHPNPSVSNVYCVCGDACFCAEVVQSGVFRCLMSPQTPGLLNFYLSFDGHKPISQVLTFECRSALTHEEIASSEDIPKWEEFQVQMRLAHLLFSKSNSLKIWSTKVSQNSLKQAKMFADRTSHIFNGWAQMIKSVKSNEISFLQAKDSLFELILKNKLQEWLLEKVIDGSKISYHDDQGQGVIHLCAILGYTWAVHLFSRSGLSLDYRDKFGWTALHWAAYYGREEMVGALLSAGAKANLVTDPTSENPDGCTAADLASQRGHEGFAGYLAEKALVQHFQDMTIAGNVGGSLQTSTTDVAVDANLDQEEIYLKDTLAAYRTAVDAAARIEAAFREHSFKLRAKVVESSNPEDEARNIVAAMKIQHAFRRYGKRKQMKAAAHIQQTFRTWKIRKNFLNMRRQAIRIQSVFRGYQVRRQYKKIVWSVGVLEKAILRWRLKRKGFRGLQVDTVEVDKDQRQASVAEEDFFRASRKQAEERVERSVVRVQAMFRSKKAQEEYQKLKLAYNQAKLEYEETLDSDNNMA